MTEEWFGWNDLVAWAKQNLGRETDSEVIYTKLLEEVTNIRNREYQSIGGDRQLAEVSEPENAEIAELAREIAVYNNVQKTQQETLEAYSELPIQDIK